MTRETTAPMIGRRCPDGPGGRDCHCCGQAPGVARKTARGRPEDRPALPEALRTAAVEALDPHQLTSARTPPPDERHDMTDLPYTDADLRAEAARHLDPDVDGLEILTAMADRAPWNGLSTDDFNRAHGEVVQLAEGAADVSEWAVNLGADGLEPSDQALSPDVGVRIHFAFTPDVPDDVRRAWIDGIHHAIREGL